MKTNKSLVIISSFIFILIFILVQFTCCNALENVSISASKLIVELITGNDLDGEAGSTTVFVDVIAASGTIFNDNATATLSSVLLDPAQASGTFYQDIIVDQIDISYSRTDGLSVEGRDVPYSFSQQVYARVPVGSSIELDFVLVQHIAKLESPLVELIPIGQEKILKLEAHITFYGKDIAGNRVDPAAGSISLWCADFADDN